MRGVTKGYFIAMRIVDLIFAILLCITIIGLIFAIPLFMAANKFREASEMDTQYLILNKGSILGWGIFSAIVLSATVIGLIVILVFAIIANNYIDELQQNVNAANAGGSTTATVSDAPKTNEGSEEKQLKDLKKMFDDGLITAEEYETKRKKILGI